MVSKQSMELEALKFQQKQIELQMTNSENFKLLIKEAVPLVKEYLKHKSEAEKPKVKWSLIGFMGILFVIVLITGFLVYAGKMDSSNFTFLLGTLVGGAITFLGDLILPSS